MSETNGRVRDPKLREVLWDSMKKGELRISLETLLERLANVIERCGKMGLGFGCLENAWWAMKSCPTTDGIIRLSMVANQRED